MRAIRIGASLALLIGVASTATVAEAGVSGTVTAIAAHEITVSGAVYPIAESTSVEDFAGHVISLPELRPGTPVELEFDEQGGLATIRATVVR